MAKTHTAKAATRAGAYRDGYSAARTCTSADRNSHGNTDSSAGAANSKTRSMLKVNKMEEAQKQTRSMSEICSKIVTEVINETKGPQHALSVLTKSIYCVLKFAEIEIDDELEEQFRHMFSKEYIKERIEKIEIHLETKEEYP